MLLGTYTVISFPEFVAVTPLPVKFIEDGDVTNVTPSSKISNWDWVYEAEILENIANPSTALLIVISDVFTVGNFTYSVITKL